MVDRSLRILGSLAAVLVALTAVGWGHAADPRTPPEHVGISSATVDVTVYGAAWCSACRHLEAALTGRQVPFVTVDVDRDREAYEKARAASGMGPGIPLTHIARDTAKWVQGDDADAVERAYKGE